MSDNVPFWEKVKAASTLVSTVVIPLVVVLIANNYTQKQKESELAVRYIELAVGILRAAPDDQTRPLRKWAVAVIDHNSIVPLPDDVKKSLESTQLSYEDIMRRLEAQNIEGEKAIRSIK